MIWNRKGVALLAVIALISILLTAGLHLAGVAGRSVLVTGQRNDRYAAREMALSAIHLAMAVLADDAGKNDMDSIQEDWANPEILAEMLSQMGFDPGQLFVQITDELGKIQVNALLKEFPGHHINPDQLRLWENLLHLLTVSDKSADDLDPQAVVNALKDWLDSGDDGAVSGLTGAETPFYRTLSPPYDCKNGPLDQVRELLDISGIGPDLFKRFQEEDDLTVMFEDVFTVHGLSDVRSTESFFSYSGRININTAGIVVLKSLLPKGMDEFAQDLIDFREEKSEDDLTFVNPLDKGWYSRVIDLSKQEKDFFDRMICYRSHIFKVSTIARVNQATVRLSGFIKREQHPKTNQWICRLIQIEES
jgi:general secretion pathway protein K